MLTIWGLPLHLFTVALLYSMIHIPRDKRHELRLGSHLQKSTEVLQKARHVDRTRRTNCVVRSKTQPPSTASTVRVFVDLVHVRSSYFHKARPRSQCILFQNAATFSVHIFAKRYWSWRRPSSGGLPLATPSLWYVLLHDIYTWFYAKAMLTPAYSRSNPAFWNGMSPMMKKCMQQRV